MSEHSQKLKEQMNFFDYIYPWISREINELKNTNDTSYRLMLEMKASIGLQNEIIGQYKGKIQRIEQFLIKRGLIELLGKE